MKRVVITGIGAVTPLANNFVDSWSFIKKGCSAISSITKFDTVAIPWKMAGEVKSFDPLPYLSPKEIRTADLFAQYAVSAAIMAVSDAGIMPYIENSDADERSLNFGVVIGSSRGGIGSIERELRRLYRKKSGSSFQRLSPYLMPSSTTGIAASTVAQKLKINGRCFGISCACSSGTVAIGEAYRIIKDGYSKIMLAGGSEAPVCELCLVGYGSSCALSSIKEPSASRPFDSGRDGFVIAEGAAILMLEEYEHAKNRGADIYGEIIGYSNTTDAYHITKPALDGEIRTMKFALKSADIAPEAVDYISAHATSTPIGDSVEAQAIKTVFKNNPELPVSSIKSMTGHMLAASGAFESACTLMSLKEGVIPPSINLMDKDPACDINVITEMKTAPLGIALSNSFGFGGMNAVIVMKRVD